MFFCVFTFKGGNCIQFSFFGPLMVELIYSMLIKKLNRGKKTMEFYKYESDNRLNKIQNIVVINRFYDNYFLMWIIFCSQILLKFSLHSWTKVREKKRQLCTSMNSKEYTILTFPCNLKKNEGDHSNLNKSIW